MVPIQHYLILGAALFTIGVVGVLTRRNIMVILMSIELMMNAVNINLIAFSWPGVRNLRYYGRRCGSCGRTRHCHRHVQEQGNDEYQRNRLDEVVGA
jgi:hypothetical protein